jgi:nucleolar pre-ribosomal-associated protein 1
MQNRNGWAPSPALWTYLDECMLRLVRRPIKYQGDVLELLQRRSSVTPHDEDEPVSLLIIVLTEQWPFLATRQGQKDLSNIAIWLDRYLSLSKSIGENLGVIRNCRSYLQESTTDRTIERLLRRSNDNTTENPISKYNQAPLQETHNTISVSSSPRSLLDLGAKEYPYDTCEPPKEGSSHGGLNRWLKDDLADAIEGGHIGTLIMCLCSQFAEIRKQALANLKLLMSKLKIGLTTEGESVQPNASRHSHGNQHQLYILVGELYETASGMLATESMPSYVASFAAHVVLVLHRPLHPIYAKINKFLLQKPSWNPRSLPSYWLDMVVTQSPTIDDRHTDELDWVLDTLFEGLCTSHVSTARDNEKGVLTCTRTWTSIGGAVFSRESWLLQHLIFCRDC